MPEHGVRHARHGRGHGPEAEHADHQPQHAGLAGGDVAVQHERRPGQPQRQEQQCVETERRGVQFRPEHVCQRGHTGHRHEVEEQLGPARVPLDPGVLGLVVDVHHQWPPGGGVAEIVGARVMLMSALRDEVVGWSTICQLAGALLVVMARRPRSRKLIIQVKLSSTDASIWNPPAAWRVENPCTALRSIRRA